MALEVHILGSVDLGDGARRRQLGSARERLALAALAWDAGGSVPVETLFRRIWDDDPPPSARQSLYTFVSHIRAAMRELTGDQAPSLENQGNAYRLGIPRSSVDVWRYHGLTDEARTLADGGSLAEALRRLSTGADLWRGEPLAGLPGTWAEQKRRDLAEKRLGVAILLAGIRLRLGRFAEAVADLSPLVDAHPTDESLIEHLVLALYGQKRISDANRVLQRARHHLIRELGIDLNDQLRRIQQGVFQQVPLHELLAASGLVAFTGGGADDGVAGAFAPDNLPPDLAVWVGRRAEGQRIEEVLRGGESPLPLAVIDGMPGVGKTALAVHVAHRLRKHFPDGRILLDLGAYRPEGAPLTTTALLTELLRLIGQPPRVDQHDPDQLVAAWRSAMSSRRALVILDNATSVEQIRPLLLGTGRSRLLITSRHRLSGLGGVRPLSIDTLPEADAVAMFLERVGSARVPSPGTAADIVRLCGHLPLAIDIIASRFISHPSWTADELLARLTRRDDRIREIRDPTRKMEQIFDLAYRYLTPVQQRVFRCLGLRVAPTFGPHAAAALADLPLDQTEQAVEDLLNLHLLTEPAPDRFGMHDLLTSFARGRAAADSDESRQQAMARLVDLYLHTADLADRRLHPYRLRIDVDGPPPEAATRWLSETEAHAWCLAEAPSLLALLEHTRGHQPPRTAALFSHVLALLLDAADYLAAAQPYLRQAVTYWRETGADSALVRALLDLGAASTRSADYGEAVQATAAALRLAQRSADTDAESECRHRLATIYYHMGDLREALGHAEAAVRLRMRHAGRLQQARSRNVLASVLLNLGRLDEARVNFLDALEGFRATGYTRGMFLALNNLGELSLNTGDQSDAVRFYREAMTIASTAGSGVDHATLRINLAASLVASQRAQDALVHYRQALPTFRKAGDKRHEAIALNGIGTVLRTTGRFQEAISYHAAALALARRIRAATEEAQALRGLGSAEWSLGRAAEAIDHLEAGLAVADHVQSPTERLETLRVLAEVRSAAPEGMAHGDT